MTITSETSNAEITIGGEPYKAQFARFHIEATTSDAPQDFSAEGWDREDGESRGELTGFLRRGASFTMPPEIPQEMLKKSWHRLHRRIGRVIRRRKNRSRH